MSNSGDGGGPREEEDVGSLPFEDDIDIEEEEDEIPTLAPEHRLFKRLQDDLKRQLETAHDNLEVETRDKLAMKSKLVDSPQDELICGAPCATAGPCDI
jgi:hypothetical protein